MSSIHSLFTGAKVSKKAIQQSAPPVPVTLPLEVINVNPEKISDLQSALKAVYDTLTEEDVTDLMINDHKRIYVEKNSRVHAAPFILENEALVYELAEKLAEHTGKSAVLNEYFALDGMLPEGHRITIIMPPAVIGSPSISIRRFPKEVITLDDMVKSGQMTEQMAAFLKVAVARRANILISGNTSSGKTTLLNALTVHIPEGERLVTIEDTPEIKAQQDNVVRLEINEIASKSGPNYATARDLLRATLRIRPDRIIMGEIRGAEAFDLLQAINTGHKGSMGTMHSNTPREALSRLEQMVSLADLDISTVHVRQHISASLNLLIQTHRNHQGQRRITHITELVGMEGEIFLTHDHFIYKRDAWGKPRHHWIHGNSRNLCIKEALEAAAACQANP